MSAPNPAMERFAFLVGVWDTVGKHPMLPHALKGEVSFEWLEGGAFLIMRSRFNEPGIPTGVAIFGSDDALGEYHMLYFDERGVSRRYEVAIDTNSWRWIRNAPDFAQRYVVTVAPDRRTMEGRGELSRDGTTWEQDLGVTYRLRTTRED